MHKIMPRGGALVLFLIGLFSQTQVHVFGSIGISELPIFAVAPFIFLHDYRDLKRDCFMPFIWLTIAVCVGCVVSSWYNQTYWLLALKGLATPYSIFAITVVLHHLLRKNPMAIKWLFVGIFLSMIVCVFVFQQETNSVVGGERLSGAAATEAVMSYPLFWSIRFAALVALPIKCAYLATPTAYLVLMPLVAGIISIVLSDSSGRAAAMITLLGIALLVIGGKSQQKLRRMGKQLPLVALVAICLMAGGKVAYSYAAKTGLLGEKAREKYIRQTAMGKSTLRILMAGRKEFFVGMIAALDRPIIGHGPKAEDTKGYFTEYLRKYGSIEDFQQQLWELRQNEIHGGGRYYMIPTHSFVASFWVYYGIAGLVFWIYALGLFWQYFRRYAPMIPQWYGYLALFLPTMVWGTFFAPFGDRMGETLPFVCILFAKAVYKKRFQLPPEMMREIAQHNRNS